MTFPWTDLADIVRGLTDLPVLTGWPSSKAPMPCVVIYPTQRTSAPNCGAVWTVALDVLQGLEADQDALHMAVEAIVPNLGVGYHADVTNYRQGSIGGADVVIAQTFITARRTTGGPLRATSRTSRA